MELSVKVFQALADPTRRQILQELKEGERAAMEIAARFEITPPSVSRHLSILRNAELIEPRREGNRILYRLQKNKLVQTLNDFVSSICPTQVIQRKKRSKRREKAR